MDEQPHATEEFGTPGSLDELPAWHFALRLYAEPRVPSVMITLQDQYGLDVSFFLFLLYLAFEERRLPDAATLNQLKLFILEWQVAVVAPLRRIRRTMKTQKPMFTHSPACKLRKEISTVELMSEQVETFLCYQWIASRRSFILWQDPSSPSGELVDQLATVASSGKIISNECSEPFAVLVVAIATTIGL